MEDQKNVKPFASDAAQASEGSRESGEREEWERPMWEAFAETMRRIAAEEKLSAHRLADCMNRLTQEEIATCMESLPTDALEWAVRFEAACHRGDPFAAGAGGSPPVRQSDVEAHKNTGGTQ